MLGGGPGEKACWERLGFGEQREIVFCSILVFSVVVLSCIPRDSSMILDAFQSSSGACESKYKRNLRNVAVAKIRAIQSLLKVNFLFHSSSSSFHFLSSSPPLQLKTPSIVHRMSQSGGKSTTGGKKKGTKSVNAARSSHSLSIFAPEKLTDHSHAS